MPAQGTWSDRKDAKASSLTARPAPSLPRDAFLFCPCSLRVELIHCCQIHPHQVSRPPGSPFYVWKLSIRTAG
ncbi:hypothetical protein CBI57_12395 [Pantoea agglomerans]|nr:hypothetical protein CBI57_12395 [Pantoea agglomerans]